VDQQVSKLARNGIEEVRGVSKHEDDISWTDRGFCAAHDSGPHHAPVVPVRASDETIDRGLGGAIDDKVDVLVTLVVFPRTRSAALSPITPLGAIEDDAVDPGLDSGGPPSARRIPLIDLSLGRDR